MALTIGIVGLPNVGKSTLFNALTKNQVLAANYPFATIEPNVGLVAVPDERLSKLTALYPSAKIVPAAVTFIDIAGLVSGAAEGQGLGNQFLAHIRNAEVICQVIRVFSDPEVMHVAGRVDPQEDISTLNTELILADLQTLEKKLPKLEREAKGDPKLALLLQTAKRAREKLDSGQTLSGSSLGQLENLQLLTAKPVIYIFNLSESDLARTKLHAGLNQLVSPAPAVMLSAKLESELSELPAGEALALLRDVGQSASGLDQLVRLGYQTLGLQTFLTAGPKEVRAWTIEAGATAPAAAGVIHSDFQKGFIKAEIVNFTDLLAAGSLAQAKAQGKVRLEGKDYVMQEGDVVEFRFNV